MAAATNEPAAAAAAASVGAVSPVPRARARLWICVSPLDVMFFVMIWVGATARENSCLAVAGSGVDACFVSSSLGDPWVAEYFSSR